MESENAKPTPRKLKTIIIQRDNEPESETVKEETPGREQAAPSPDLAQSPVKRLASTPAPEPSIPSSDEHVSGAERGPARLKPIDPGDTDPTTSRLKLRTRLRMPGTAASDQVKSIVPAAPEASGPGAKLSTSTLRSRPIGESQRDGRPPAGDTEPPPAGPAKRPIISMKSPSPATPASRPKVVSTEAPPAAPPPPASPPPVVAPAPSPSALTPAAPDSPAPAPAPALGKGPGRPVPPASSPGVVPPRGRPTPGGAPPPSKPPVPAPQERKGDGRPKLKQKQTKLPDNLSKPPEETAKKGQHFSFLAAALSVILVVVACGLASTQAWREWSAGGALPVSELIVIGIVVIVFAALIMTRSLALRVIAGLILLAGFAACLLVGVLGVLLLQVVPPEFLPAELVTQLPPPGLLAGSAALILAAFCLLFGSGPVQWALAVICMVLGAGLPWLPLEEYLPDPPAQPIVAQIEELTFIVPVDFLPVDDTESTGEDAAPSRVFRAAEGSYAITIARGPSTEEVDLDGFSNILIETYRQRNTGAGVFLAPVLGRPHQRRMRVLGDPRADVLLIAKDRFFYTVKVEGSKQTFDERGEEIQALFERLE